MEKVWLVKVLFTDGATYSVYETVAICTGEVEAAEFEREAQLKYPGQNVIIEKEETNKFDY